MAQPSLRDTRPDGSLLVDGGVGRAGFAHVVPSGEERVAGSGGRPVRFPISSEANSTKMQQTEGHGPPSANEKDHTRSADGAGAYYELTSHAE